MPKNGPDSYTKRETIHPNFLFFRDLLIFSKMTRVNQDRSGKATYRRNAAILNFTRTEKVLHDGLELLIRRETGSKIIFWGTVQLIVISGFCCDSIFHTSLTADHEEGFFNDISTNVLKTPYSKD